MQKEFQDSMVVLKSYKESDRLKAMQIGLDSMKIKNFFDGETFCIEGRGKDYRPVD